MKRQEQKTPNKNDFGFYEMVRYWVRSDHYNPTIQCEIIWDMLLSEFICDMMRAHCENAKDVRLLAKEFPYGKTAYDEKTGELKGSERRTGSIRRSWTGSRS